MFNLGHLSGPKIKIKISWNLLRNVWDSHIFTYNAYSTFLLLFKKADILWQSLYTLVDMLFFLLFEPRNLVQNIKRCLYTI
jgi:hypothetical protein